MLKSATLLLAALLAVLADGPAYASENSRPVESGDAAAEAGLTTFSRSWLTITYPKDFIMESEFRGLANTFELKKPGRSEYLFILYTPSGRAGNFSAGKSAGDNIVRSGEHPVYPGAKEVVSVIPTSGAGVTSYWRISAPINNKNALTIDVMARGDSESEAVKALETWKTVIDSIKIEPDKAAFTKWDGIERFYWDGIRPGGFNYKFRPDFGFILFRDSTASLVLNFSNESFRQHIAKSDRRAAFFMSDALVIPSGFYFNEKWPDPDDPTWENVVEGLMTIKTGLLVFGAGTSPVEAVVALPEGVYKFRVYSALVDAKNDSQEVRFYFQPTDEKENNQITVLKSGGSAVSGRR